MLTLEVAMCGSWTDQELALQWQSPTPVVLLGGACSA